VYFSCESMYVYLSDSFLTDVQGRSQVKICVVDRHGER